MNLIIHDENHLLTDKDIEALKYYIFICCKNKLRQSKKFKNIIKYNADSKIYNVDLNMVVTLALGNLKHSKFADSIVIEIDDNLKYKNINLKQVCKFIDYGTLNISGCHAISETFETIADALQYNPY